MIVLAVLLQAAVGPAPDCPDGVWLEGAGERVRIEEQLADHRKMANLASMMFLGGSLKAKAVITGGAAPVRAKTATPSFLFCFRPAAATVPSGPGGMTYVGGATLAVSPAEYRLMRFDGSSEQREFPVGQLGDSGPNLKPVEKATVRTRIEEVAPGVWRVTPAKPLKPGEYGFVKLTADRVSVRDDAPKEKVFAFGLD